MQKKTFPNVRQTGETIVASGLMAVSVETMSTDLTNNMSTA